MLLHRGLINIRRSSLRCLSTNASALAHWNADDQRFFERLLSPSAVLSDPQDTQAFTTDWLRKYAPPSSYRHLVLRPKTTQQVSEILRYCNTRRLGVVPQGGNTGLVGGSVPTSDEIVLSLGAMHNVVDFDEVSGVLTCEAGCVLESLDQFLATKGYMMPLDLGAKGTCQIGGNLATNAGGLRLLRYGSLHGSVLGVEAVLADGTIIDNLSTMRKDNTGYDLKQLFIGSEGTLGVVTKVAILTPVRPAAVNVALLGCPDFQSVQKTLVSARKQLGEVLSAVEFMDRASVEMVRSQQPTTRDPLDTECPYYVLLETSGSNSTHDVEKLDGFLESAMGDGLVVDGTVAQDSQQARTLFMLREDISVALSQRGYVYKYDISLPLDSFERAVGDVRDRVSPLDPEITVVGFGHLGDGNLHLNVSTPKANDRVLQALEPFVFEWTAKVGGSISAEHGIGTHKPPFLHLSKASTAIALMRQLKQTLDPNGILNPGKVLPSTEP